MPLKNTSKYTDGATQYALDVASGKIVAGPHVRAACARHLDDLENAHKRGLVWDVEGAERVFGFFRDILRLSEGDHEGRPFELEPAQKFIVGSLFGWKDKNGDRRFRVGYIEQGKGNGKALDVNTLVFTPKGFKKMLDLEEGDQVFDEKGRVCNVIAVTPVLHGRECYAVSFSDGHKVVADAEHLWVTTPLRTGLKKGIKDPSLPAKGKPSIFTTRQIEETLKVRATPTRDIGPKTKVPKWNHRVEVPKQLVLPYKELVIKPYTLGVWLGDGDNDSARITAHTSDIEIPAKIRQEGYACTGRAYPSRGQVKRFTISDKDGRSNLFLNGLRELGLIKNKHIPREYFTASYEQRLELLRGLMDTDGTSHTSGACEFCVTSRTLAEDAAFLIRTLGYKVSFTESEARLRGEYVSQRYRVQFFPDDRVKVFYLNRKYIRQKAPPKTRAISSGRRIVGCDRVASTPVKCIQVDSPSGMYLVGEGLIPTHNSPLCGGIGLYMMLADGEPGAECYAAAVTRDQAHIMFQDAVKMVDKSAILEKMITKSGKQSVYNLAHVGSGSFFRPVSSEGRGLDGKRVHYAAIDEVHEHASPIVCNKMRAGTKGRRQALILEITNSGHDRTSICFKHHEYSIKVANRTVQDDSWFSYVCALDEGDDPLEDPSCWLKANPLLGVSITQKYLEEQVREARGMPSQESLVMRLNFCVWVDAANPWIGQDRWRACESDKFDLEQLEGQKCFGALDLSMSKDLTAAVFAFPWEEYLVLLSRFWTPADTLLARERKDNVPYSQWVKEGHLLTCPGTVVDYDFVVSELAEFALRYDVDSIAFDPYRIPYFEKSMANQGVDLPLIAHAQGYYKSSGSDLWMPRSIELLEKRVADQKLIVIRNPVLTWNSASAVLEEDGKANRIFTKRKSTGRIDGIVTSAMAVGNAEREEVEEVSFWESL